MSSGVPYIGSKISLITTSDMRYEGFLRTLNREESTIAVESVRSFGTEGRADQTRGQAEIPVSNEIYDFIVFRGKDLKDLTVLQGIPENAPQPQPQQTPATRPPVQSPHMQGSYGQHLNKKNIEYDTGPGMYHSQIGPSAMGNEGPSSGFGASGYQRPSPPAVSRNGYGPPPSSCGGSGVGHMSDSLGGGYLSSTGSRAPSEKSGYGQVRIEAPSRTPPSYHDGPHGPPPSYVERPAPTQYEDLPAGPPRGGAGCGHGRMGDEGKGGPPAPRPPGAMTSHGPEGKDRSGHGAYGMAGAPEGKGANAGFGPSAVEAKGRGRGKGGQKQTLSEVLKQHTKAQDAIVKLMRQQGSAAVSPHELRAMSEQGCIYHFYLDYLNFCGPASGGNVLQSDEQNWDSLAKALKKHFEKEFGSGPTQQKTQPQRPNNTLADFITVDTKTNSKKNAKVQPTAAKAARGGAGRGGRGAGAKAKEVESTAADDDDPTAMSQWACPRCTLKNENHLLECLACGTNKQTAALWAEFPPLGS